MSARAHIFQSVRDRLPVGFTLTQFEAATAEWEAIPVNVGGRTVGGVLAKGNELHVGFDERPRASIRGEIRRILRAHLERHGRVITTVQRGNSAGLRFCERLGFSIVRECDGLIYLQCERANYV